MAVTAGMLSRACHLLSPVEIVLSLQGEEPGSLTAMLHQLQGLHLQAVFVYAKGISPAEEALLATCSVQQLGVILLDPTIRLQRPPAGVPITYSTERIDSDELMSRFTMTEST